MKLPLPDRSKTLEQLDGEQWGEPEYESGLVQECHRLRRIPLREFTPADFRILIGQNIGLEYLAPLALEILTADPLVDAEYYSGDLLSAMLRSDPAFWSGRPHLRTALGKIVEIARDRYTSLDRLDRGQSEEDFRADLLHFARSGPP